MSQSRTQRARNRSALPGAWAEQRALRLLRQRGWELLASRWRCRWGELDLVLAKPGRLLVVEVKGRRRCGADGWGVAALGPGKRRRLARALSCWLAEHPQRAHWPLEVVCALVPLPPAGGAVRWLRLESLALTQGEG
ncbi:YraN family protein [Synechococcus sp. CS-1329]|uniref:YraN family protein n=1 Tax=Synechococcus sp. CS-1329 TaxID=2847975 RepID=UPI00223B02A2|nr:YraN family protein [Synechococcus sp. CS-1329]MCT0219979.1 YraN family protein [Synechococcus sp. CS-1329]